MTRLHIKTLLRAALLLQLLAGASAMAAEEAGHLHHLHMNVNVASIERTTAFYRRFFGVTAVRYAGKTPVLAMERSFLFMNEVGSRPILNHQLTGLTHGCWATIDGNYQYEWLKKQGVEFYTPVAEYLPGSTYMYLYGPDREVIEMSDAAPHHRFNHIHMVATDAKQTAQWFHDLLNFETPVASGPMKNENLVIDNVLLTVFPIGARFTPRENDGTLRNTDGSNLDHIAFSFRDIKAAYRRVRKQGVEIVKPLDVDAEYGFRHFFVRAPNGVLVELVEARPWPDAAWEK